MLRLARVRILAPRASSAFLSSSSCLRAPKNQPDELPLRHSKKLALHSATAWQRVVAPAFRAFLEKRGHLMVPTTFRVPRDNEWPEESWRYPLGAHACWLRKIWRHEIPVPSFARSDLEDMDFAYDWSQYKWDHYLLPALRRYYELHGDTDVAQAFRIPEGDPKWPKKLWGLVLGPRVFNIRHRGDFAIQVEKDAEELAKLRFCYNSTTYERDWSEKVLPSLRTYFKEFGHCDVARSFIVPKCAPWPESAGGMTLGILTNNVRNKGYYAEQINRDRAELDAIGFTWDHSTSYWEDCIFPALKTYSEVYHKCYVPKAFIVPSEAPWPKRTHGLKLGIAMNNIRSYGYYFDQTSRNVDLLVSIGFILRVPEAKWFARVAPLLDTFEQVHGHRRVPLDFVVPSEEPWEASSWGIQLGKLQRRA